MWLGRIGYLPAYELQKEIFNEVLNKTAENTFITCEHNDVITVGRNSLQDANLLYPREILLKNNYEIFDTDRGGDVTYHGLGQLVGYPIIRLSDYKEDLGWYLRALEEVIILALKDFNIVGFRSKVNTGVWVNGNDNKMRKICAIGIKASRWVTMHGFALNVFTDLARFQPIVPCGIKDFGVTSILQESNKKYSLEEVTEICFKKWDIVFSQHQINQDFMRVTEN